MKSLKFCVHRAPIVSVYRNSGHRFVFYQCQDCGKEWTEGVAVEDLADVVTSDEIIEVHRLLEQDNKTLSEMTD